MVAPGRRGRGMTGVWGGGWGGGCTTDAPRGGGRHQRGGAEDGVMGRGGVGALGQLCLVAGGRVCGGAWVGEDFEREGGGGAASQGR